MLGYIYKGGVDGLIFKWAYFVSPRIL